MKCMNCDAKLDSDEEYEGECPFCGKELEEIVEFKNKNKKKNYVKRQITFVSPEIADLSLPFILGARKKFINEITKLKILVRRTSCKRASFYFFGENSDTYTFLIPKEKINKYDKLMEKYGSELN